MKTGELLDRITPQLEKFEKKLNRNYYQQFFFIILGFSVIFKKKIFVLSFLEYLNSEQDDFIIMISTLSVLQILFMRFGYLLSNFIATRKLHLSLINELTDKLDGNDEKKKMIEISLRPISFFEILNPRKRYIKYPYTFWFFYILIFGVLFLNHIVCLSLVKSFVTDNSILKYSLYIIYLTINFFLYREFIKGEWIHGNSKRFKRFGYLTLVLIIFFTICLELFF